MKTKALFWMWVACVGTLLWLPFDSQEADRWQRTPIFDESADGSKQIADALFVAKKANKHVLVEFGANWCIWCHRLHRFFETDRAVSGKLGSDFVVVSMDVSNGHNALIVSQYGEVTQSGIPAIVVLDSDGTLIGSATSLVFAENGDYKSNKILVFLNGCITK